MGRHGITSLFISFTSDGDYLAILSPDGTVKIWNTGSCDLLAEWNLDGDSDVSYTCMRCSFVGKKRKKEHRTFLLVLGTQGGDVLAVNVFTGERKWTNKGCHFGGISALTFANEGLLLYTAGTDGLVSELNSETGEIIGKFEASRKPITSLALSPDEKLLAVASEKMWLFNLDTKKKLLKFSSGPVQYTALSDDGKAAVTAVSGGTQLQLWACDKENKSGIARAVLFMRGTPVMLECRSVPGEEGMVVLSVSEKGAAYMWNTKKNSEEEVSPVKIVMKSSKQETNLQVSKKNHTPVIAARICNIERNEQLSILLAYGSLSNMRFHLLALTDPNPGEPIYIDTDAILQEVSMPNSKAGNLQDPALGATDTPDKLKKRKKRLASDQSLSSAENETESGMLHELDASFDINEPTMGEKLASLSLLDNGKSNGISEKEPFLDIKPPSADSVHVLLKQALHAEDHKLLLNCLYTRDEKVIINSISMLNPSDVFKLLNSLVSMIHSRGAALICILPWLRCLFIQHASSTMCQESSFCILNSLYQLIESRVSTFGLARQLSASLDFLFAGIPGDEFEDEDKVTPIIYEDKDSDDEDEAAMESGDEEGEYRAPIDSPQDSEGSDVMSE